MKPGPVYDETDLRRRRRFREFATVVVVGTIFIALRNSLAGNWQTTSIMLAASAIVLYSMITSERSDVRPDRSYSFMLATVTGMVIITTWMNHGAHEAGLAVFPIILLGAGMLAGRATFFAIAAAILASINLNIVLNVTGRFVNALGPTDFRELIEYNVVIMGTVLAVWMIVSDLHRAMTRLRHEARRSEEARAMAEHRARHDLLTDLPNRLSARDRFDQVTAYVRRNGSKAALLFLDLDDFKAVNDSLGHQLGDQLLLAVAGRLRGFARGTDTICRLGGDEFLVVLGEIGESAAAATVASGLVDRLAAPFQVNGHEISAGGSVGIAVFPNDGDEFDALLQKAEVAMYRAKEAGRNTFRFFENQMNEGVVERLQLVSGLRSAVAKGELVLYYQPQFHLASRRLVGVEALLRWRHPTLGMVPPATFIPVAEKSGLIGEIGDWVLHKACRQARAWQEAGLPRITVAVNISAVQFRRGNIEQSVFDALERSGLDPALLELEVTESSFIDDPDTFGQVLRRLRALGTPISIDDFGTGYSSLSYLQRFPIDRLKIDQSFVRRLTTNDSDTAIVAAIIQVARSLKMATIAEGIEDEAALERLKAIGCDDGQGFLFARPMSAEAILATYASPSQPERRLETAISLAS